MLPGVAKRVVHTHVLLAAPGAALWPRPGTGGCSPSAPSTSPVLASPQHPAGIFQLWGKKTPRLCVMEKWQNGRVEKKKTCPEQGAGDKEGSGSVRSRAASATTWRWHRERGASSAAFRHRVAGCVGPAAPQNPLCFPKSRGLGWATLLQPHPGDVSPAAAPFSPLSCCPCSTPALDRGVCAAALAKWHRGGLLPGLLLRWQRQGRGSRGCSLLAAGAPCTGRALGG